MLESMAQNSYFKIRGITVRSNFSLEIWISGKHKKYETFSYIIKNKFSGASFSSKIHGFG